MAELDNPPSSPANPRIEEIHFRGQTITDFRNIATRLNQALSDYEETNNPKPLLDEMRDLASECLTVADEQQTSLTVDNQGAPGIADPQSSSMNEVEDHQPSKYHMRSTRFIPAPDKKSEPNEEVM